MKPITKVYLKESAHQYSEQWDEGNRRSEPKQELLRLTKWPNGRAGWSLIKLYQQMARWKTTENY